jgi:hypothetical protein
VGRWCPLTFAAVCGSSAWLFLCPVALPCRVACRVACRLAVWRCLSPCGVALFCRLAVSPCAVALACRGLGLFGSWSVGAWPPLSVFAFGWPLSSVLPSLSSLSFGLAYQSIMGGLLVGFGICLLGLCRPPGARRCRRSFRRRLGGAVPGLSFGVGVGVGLGPRAFRACSGSAVFVDLPSTSSPDIAGGCGRRLWAAAVGGGCGRRLWAAAVGGGCCSFSVVGGGAAVCSPLLAAAVVAGPLVRCLRRRSWVRRRVADACGCERLRSERIGVRAAAGRWLESAGQAASDRAGRLGRRRERRGWRGESAHVSRPGRRLALRGVVMSAGNRVAAQETRRPGRRCCRWRAPAVLANVAVAATVAANIQPWCRRAEGRPMADNRRRR